jgi:hypothetical protein
MPDDHGLSDLFHASDAPRTPPIDANEIIRRSRRRRLPRQIGAGSVFTLAIAGIGVAGVTGLGNLARSTAGSASSLAVPPVGENGSTPGSTAGSTSGSTSGSAGAGTGTTGGTTGVPVVPGEKGNAPGPASLPTCGSRIADVAASPGGLSLTVSFPNAPARARSVEGTVTVTNRGTARITGYTAVSPTVALARDGIVVWHSNGPTIQIAREIDLAPGQSVTYSATLVPVVCTAGDDMGGSLPANLPAAPAGEYQVFALIVVNHDGTADAVGGPAVAITLN